MSKVHFILSFDLCKIKPVLINKNLAKENENQWTKDRKETMMEEDRICNLWNE